MELGNGTGPGLGMGMGGGHNFSHILSSLKRSNLSIGNRLRSIHSDSAFVLRVSAAYGDRPLVANERCGSWYIPPGHKSGSAYFKSTDGHHGQWSFSTRRLNLGLLEIVGREDGCVIVDSTRRGKRMPDALSKTVPLWCCVMNRVLFPDGFPRAASPANSPENREGQDEEDDEGDIFALHTPPNAVSRSEHIQMEARIQSQVEALQSLNIDLEGMRRRIQKPLRPVWVTRDSVLPDEDLSALSPFFEKEHHGDEEETGKDDGAAVKAGRRKLEEETRSQNGGKNRMEVFKTFHPIICCTSSRRVVGEAEMGDESGGSGNGGAGYIQGAGDDTENWALGLTPPVFWENAELLLGTPDHELPGLVRDLVAKSHIAVSSSSSRGTGGDATKNRLEDVGKQLAPGLFVADRGSVSILTTMVPPSFTEKEVHHSPDDDDDDDDENCCTIVFHPRVTDPNTWEEDEKAGDNDDNNSQRRKRRRIWRMDVGIGAQPKLAGRNLRTALPRICDFVERYYLASKAGGEKKDDDDDAKKNKNEEEEEGSSKTQATATTTTENTNDKIRGAVVVSPRILIACETSRDLSIGLALALLCRFPDKFLPTITTTTNPNNNNNNDIISKTTIKQKLGRIMTAYPEANPSRATLQSVNSYLMG